MTLKSRKGFVSNSSSSSFVVAVHDECNPICTVTLTADLSRFGRIIRTEKELYSYAKDHYWFDSSGQSEDYANALKAIQCGKSIIAGAFGDDSDDPIEVLLCNNGLPESNKYDIIFNEAGY